MGVQRHLPVVLVGGGLVEPVAGRWRVGNHFAAEVLQHAAGAQRMSAGALTGFYVSVDETGAARVEVRVGTGTRDAYQILESYPAASSLVRPSLTWDEIRSVEGAWNRSLTAPYSHWKWLMENRNEVNIRTVTLLEGILGAVAGILESRDTFTANTDVRPWWKKWQSLIDAGSLAQEALRQMRGHAPEAAMYAMTALLDRAYAHQLTVEVGNFTFNHSMLEPVLYKNEPLIQYGNEEIIGALRELADTTEVTLVAQSSSPLQGDDQSSASVLTQPFDAGNRAAAVSALEEVLRKGITLPLAVSLVLQELGGHIEEVQLAQIIRWYNEKHPEYPLGISGGEVSMRYAMAGSSPMQTGDKGGVDFANLPIMTQPFANAPLLRAPQQLIPAAELDAVWGQMQKMVKAGIRPSNERLIEYAFSCCQQRHGAEGVEKVLACIADILRMEEEEATQTDAQLMQLLTQLEAQPA